MKEGIFAIHFSQNIQWNFSLINGKIGGADADYFYQGSYETTGNELTASIDVKNYSGRLTSPLNSEREYRLQFEGTISEQALEGTMTSSGQSLPITAQLLASF